MLEITRYLNLVNSYLSITQGLVLTAGQLESGHWLVGDSELDIATLIVVHYMVKNDITRLGNLTLIKSNLNYALVNSDFY